MTTTYPAISPIQWISGLELTVTPASDPGLMYGIIQTGQSPGNDNIGGTFFLIGNLTSVLSVGDEVDIYVGEVLTEQTELGQVVSAGPLSWPSADTDCHSAGHFGSVVLTQTNWNNLVNNISGGTWSTGTESPEATRLVIREGSTATVLRNYNVTICNPPTDNTKKLFKEA